LKPTFFATPVHFRRWLERHHGSARELLVGFYKRGSGKPSITWPESVDQALCFGWIDGVRRRIDEVSYTIRFTARKRTSIWSKINITKARLLAKAGLMRPAGLAAFAARREFRSGIYSYENRPATLPAPYQRRMKGRKKAWRFFQSQPAGYRKVATWWVISAKKEETRLKRLAVLIADCAAGRPLRHLVRLRPAP
jgi:uncharacterized protein YdeI (YjbR/CyaY-like superfamily)